MAASVATGRLARPSLPDLFDEVQMQVHDPHFGDLAVVDPVEGELLDPDPAAGPFDAGERRAMLPMSVKCAGSHGASTMRWRNSHR